MLTGANEHEETHVLSGANEQEDTQMLSGYLALEQMLK